MIVKVVGEFQGENDNVRSAGKKIFLSRDYKVKEDFMKKLENISYLSKIKVIKRFCNVLAHTNPCLLYLLTVILALVNFEC